MITLYQLHWSHYVEKVRWALDFKGVEWTAVDVDPFTKREMRHIAQKTTAPSGAQLYTVPTLYDAATGAVVGESSTIVCYLENTYPSPALYPRVDAEREEVMRWMVWLDSTVGPAARRLAYTQMALELPGYLAQLFFPALVSRGGVGSLRARVLGATVGGVLAQRFRFLYNRADRVFEQLEQCLLFAARRLNEQPYLVGNQFTAADITLAALLRPVSLVPYFRHHPRLRSLFEWRSEQLRQHRREATLGYETALDEVRRRNGWALGAVEWLPESQRANSCELTELPTLSTAHNDHQAVSRFPAITGPLWYMRLALTCGLGRTSYP